MKRLAGDAVEVQQRLSDREVVRLLRLEISTLQMQSGRRRVFMELFAGSGVIARSWRRDRFGPCMELM